jgi:XTP/dITP diphosphohydrolase
VTKLVLATRNPHKVAELRRILSDAGLDDLELVGAEVFPGIGDVVESGVTFEENAALKARAVAGATGAAAIADDSGLCVDVLGGAPGVFSARWSGSHGDDLANLQLLLDQLRDVPDEHRGAHFTCAAVLALPDGTLHAAEGRLDGRLIREPRGSGGFGYDPIFVPVGESRTTAQLSPAAKDAVSHRGRAFRSIVPAVRRLLPR